MRLVSDIDAANQARLFDIMREESPIFEGMSKMDVE